MFAQCVCDMLGVSTEILLAQAPDLVTDRPDQTESSAVVPLGFAQIETGYLYTRDSGSSSREVTWNTYSYWYC